MALGLQQRAPSGEPQRYGEAETPGPVAGDHGPLPRLPQDRLEASIDDFVDDLVVAAHHGAEYGPGLLAVGEDRLLAAPDERQPLTGHDRLRSDRDPGEKAIEIGEHHAVRRRALGTQERVEFFGLQSPDRNSQPLHARRRGE